MRRAWATILPPMDTPANMKMRNSIITMLEIDEWTFRESVGILINKIGKQYISIVALPYNAVSVTVLFFSITVTVTALYISRL